MQYSIMDMQVVVRRLTEHSIMSDWAAATPNCWFLTMAVSTFDSASTCSAEATATSLADILLVFNAVTSVSNCDISSRRACSSSCKSQ